ncbi:MAG: arsenite methyltransferase [Nitrospinota bacterium]
MEAEEIKKAVRERYGEIAKTNNSCSPSAPSCCGPAKEENVLRKIGKKIGYSEDELTSVPDGANMGLGCGNPVALASMKEGQTVVDLGSGGGFDCFLAAQKVGDSGSVIGVDMTTAMIEKARANAQKAGFKNVEFRLGEIDNLPVADNTADVIISNCVINLAPDKPKVFRDAFRALKPGGSLMVSDIVLLKELPPQIKESVGALTGCIAGALLKDDYLQVIRGAGFSDVEVIDETVFPIGEDDAIVKEIGREFEMSPEMIKEATDSFVSSVKVKAVKPS